MSTLQQYYEEMETEQLQALLRDDCDGLLELDTDEVLVICQVLADRAPQKPDAHAAYRRFCKYYLAE